MIGRLSKLSQNVERIRARIAAAAEQSGRAANAVKLVAVTKYVGPEIIRDLVSAGCQDLGESRPQAFWEKAESLSDLEVRWHQIGHLQRNKLKRTLPVSDLIHSVDSPRLLSAINATQAQLDPSQRQAILLEVNVSGDAAKHGFHENDLAEAIESALSMKDVELRGLMAMAGLGNSGEEARRDFSRLRELRDRMAERFPEADLAELSMGMSGDFEEAIAEGSTLVRVGSALFEGIR